MIKNISLEDLTKKISEFSVTKIALEDNVLSLSINVPKNINITDAERIIKSRFPDYVVKIMFFVDEKQGYSFKKIIGIGSGKGGVGKSMTALNLAFALRDRGFSVGILDADVYSPSIPGLLGVNDPPKSSDGALIDPVKTHGLELLSMGLLLQEGQSQIWRDDMIAAVFSQFLVQSTWTCDYLIVDFAGGMNAAYTAALSLCPHIELLMISQPNKMIYRDVIRVYALLKAMNFRIIGFVENMADEFYPKDSLDQLIDTMYINRLMTIPCFESYKYFIENTYPSDFVLSGTEKDVFFQLVNCFI